MFSRKRSEISQMDGQPENTMLMMPKDGGMILQWRHNELDGVSNHQPHGCLRNRLCRQIKENIKAPRHWPLWGEFTSDRWIPHKGLVTRKMFPFDDVIMRIPDPNLKYMYDCSQHSDHVDSLSYSLENIISQRYFAHTKAADHNKVIHTFYIVY